MKHSQQIIWTSSLTFHPQVIDWLLPTLVYILDPIHGAYFSDNSADLLLPLTVPFLSCTPSENQVSDALNDLAYHKGKHLLFYMYSIKEIYYVFKVVGCRPL